MGRRVRIANFMDSCLEALERKGNLATAPFLYNPGKHAEKVVHFTPCPADVKYRDIFAPWSIEVFPYFTSPSDTFLSRALPGALRRVYRKMVQEGLNVVRGRLPYQGSFMGCLAAKALGIPSIVSLGGNNRIAQERDGTFHYGSKFISYNLERLVLLLADVVHVPNSYTKHYVASIIGTRRAERKTVVIPWILDSSSPPSPARGDTLQRMGIDPAVPVVLTVGFLNKYKYSDVLFEAIKEINASWSGRAQFVFCGDGPLRPAGEALFKGVPNVSFLGWQDNRLVRALIGVAAVVLVAMSGFVLLEAAAAGRAVVASNVEWHPEIIQDGVTGRLVNPVSIRHWADGITNLLGDPGLRERLGTNLQQVFSARYAPDVVVEREIALYRALVQGRQSG